MIDTANSLIVCDKNCRKEKQIKELKTQYKNMLRDQENADANLTAVRREYYKASMSDPKYRKLLDAEIEENVDVIVEKLHKLAKTYILEFNNMYNIMENYIISDHNTLALIKQYQKENERMTKEINKEENVSNINHRMAYYENNSINKLVYANNIFHILSWISYIIYLVVFFIYNLYSKTSNIVFLIIVTLILLFRYIIALYRWIKRNV